MRRFGKLKAPSLSRGSCAFPNFLSPTDKWERVPPMSALRGEKSQW